MLSSSSNGLHVVLSEPQIAEWVFRTSSESQNELVARAFSVVYSLENISEVKKFDLSRPFSRALFDEFGNEYKKIPLPVNASDALLKLNKSYPSLYPSESLQETLYFEPPLRTVKVLTFVMAGPEPEAEPIRIEIPVREIDDKTLPKPRPLRESDLTILRPSNQAEYSPGDYVFLSINVNNAVPRPDSIKIICPHYTMEDFERFYHYRIRIPQDAPPGRFTVLIVAKWGNMDRPFLSRSVDLIIVSPESKCVSDCMAKN